MHQAVRNDSLWFQKHPDKIVRFRRSAGGEFQPVLNHGEEPPSFRPSFSRSNAPLTWVAVIDLMRLLGEPHDHEAPRVRLRLRIPALRSTHNQQAAEQELIDGICAELLEASGQAPEDNSFTEKCLLDPAFNDMHSLSA